MIFADDDPVPDFSQGFAGGSLEWAGGAGNWRRGRLERGAVVGVGGGSLSRLGGGQGRQK